MLGKFIGKIAEREVFRMRFLFFTIISSSFIFLNACYSHRAINNGTVFKTPFGNIREGSSMSEVVGILGNPHEVSHYRQKEIWQYDFNENGKASVYFINGNVKNIHCENTRR
jgi:outer membrane protein assembly factor BamE (lipoprotein component of BamABCDE complex)